ncbi:hypothetical protein SAMN06297422_10991 [Lachnospiraceae bacterium]|nr:hypothetical protein SAMN06297422_10991 [Lachnospiraceae bacterium]
MVKRLTSFVLSVALIVGLVNGCPSKVNAATETYTSGDYTYTLVENKSGDFDANISSYTGTETNVNVPGTHLFYVNYFK